jgi:hypothetical protein
VTRSWGLDGARPSGCRLLETFAEGVVDPANVFDRSQPYVVVGLADLLRVRERPEGRVVAELATASPVRAVRMDPVSRGSRFAVALASGEILLCELRA